MSFMSSWKDFEVASSHCMGAKSGACAANAAVSASRLDEAIALPLLLQQVIVHICGGFISSDEQRGRRSGCI